MSLETNEAALFAAARVLVVDDEPHMRKVMRTLLISIGVGTVYEAADGMAGLDQIRSLAPDVVIADWQMPGLDGPGLLRMVRSPATFCYPDVPIIMVTGHGERARVIEAARIGANDFLLKPVSAAALKERLLSVLDRPDANAQPADRLSPDARKSMSDIKADADWALAKLVMLD